MLDYKEMLRKYIMHMWDIEGTDALWWINSNASGQHFTDEEAAELERLADEIAKTPEAAR